MTQGKSEVRDGMRIDWEVPIEMDDGLVVMADIFRPLQDGKYPVLLTYGPYGKGLAFQELYTTAWEIMCEKHPDVPAGSTNQYQNWEVVDPEKWVPDGYVCARIDSRGCGRSPGVLDLWSARETKDLYDCIEWAGVQSWSNGKVGLNGISYYAMNQWQAAAIQPPHLAAICPWEGAADWYRDVARHGGILTDFLANWFDMQVLPVQHGYGERGYRSRVTGELVAGPETLSDDELEKNRRNIGADCRKREMMGDYYSSRTPDFSKIEVPLFSAANWGGQPLHPRGNFEGFVQSGSKEKWLEVHGIEHWTHFYTDYGRKQQKMFFDYTLKGENNGWKKQPRVMLQVRHPGEVFKPRAGRLRVLVVAAAHRERDAVAGGHHDRSRPQFHIKRHHLARRERLALVVGVVRAVVGGELGIELAVRGAQPALGDRRVGIERPLERDLLEIGREHPDDEEDVGVSRR